MSITASETQQMADVDTELLPPGLSGHQWTHYKSGNTDLPWLPLKPVKYYTNAYVIINNKVLLGMKKRGIGEGFYNGFGGKVDPGETSLEAAKRELFEEAGVVAPLEYASTIIFLDEHGDKTFHIDLYRAYEHTGTPIETDEMRPEWFDLPSSTSDCTGDVSSPVPYDKMWATDKHWLPLLLEGKTFTGRADFTRSDDGHWAPKRWWFGIKD